MFRSEYIDPSKHGIELWNQWRQEHRHVHIVLDGANLRDANMSEVDLIGVSLRGADLSGADLSGANLSRADLSGANLTRTILLEANLIGTNLHHASLYWAHLSEVDFSGAELSGAVFCEADLREANLTRANLSEAVLSQAYLMKANLSGVVLNNAELVDARLNRANFTKAQLIDAKLMGTDLSEANFQGANLQGANLQSANLERAIMFETILRGADLTDAAVHGISAWNLDLENALQANLVITNTSRGEPVVTVDSLEVAQFIYLLLNNPKIRDVIDTVAKKVVLILGSFSTERKIIVDTLREHLRDQDYVPVVFDFEKPNRKDFTETVSTLAHLSKFIVIDLTDPSSAPHEAATIIPQCIVPVQPLIIQDGSQYEYALFRDLQQRYHWVLPLYRYQDKDELLCSLYESVILPAEQKAEELAKLKNIAFL
jgi:uncharacterized protein YjbI with pentapeptide repeats